mgnify:CR=1 FL=1
MERSDLELVLAVRRHGSLAAAARSLHLAPPVVTKRLAALETQLGLRLFQRTTRRVSPTAEGDTLCERASVLLRDFAAVEAELRRLFYVATTRARDLLVLPIVANYFSVANFLTMANHVAIYGLLSIVFWSLVTIVTLKYASALDVVPLVNRLLGAEAATDIAVLDVPVAWHALGPGTAHLADFVVPRG